MALEELNEQFGIPGVVTFDEGKGGLRRIVIAAPGGEAEVYLLGAHVTSYRPAGAEPVLWLSDHSAFVQGRPIRGGVPVCHPWFAANEPDGGAPMHGFVRLMEWDIEAVRQAPGGDVTVVLMIKFAQGSNTAWPNNFELRHTITVGPSLSMALETLNCGQAELTITEALHTYLRVGDVRNISIHGLAGAAYHDKVAGGRGRQGDEPVTLAGETDRVYLNAPGACVLADADMGRGITLAKSGSASTVVWNPWAEKARKMPDFGDDEWPAMVCVETANALDNAVKIAPGQSHAMAARISVGGVDDRPAPPVPSARAEAAPVEIGGPAGFAARIRVAAPPSRVFEAWATAGGLARWLVAGAEFLSPGAPAPRPDGAARDGDLYRWTWPDGRVMRGDVQRAAWPEEFTFTCDPRGHCRAVFHPDGQGTLVEVAWSGTADPPARIDCRADWTFRLTNLKSVLEGGRDLRETDPARTDVVNR